MSGRKTPMQITSHWEDQKLESTTHTQVRLSHSPQSATVGPPSASCSQETTLA